MPPVFACRDRGRAVMQGSWPANEMLADILQSGGAPAQTVGRGPESLAWYDR